jgi:hypothetical protein
MNQTPLFCSELSRRAAETSFGTASIGGVWLLIEYPYPWGPNALPDSKLAPVIKNFLDRTLKNISRSRVLFIKRERGCVGGIKFYVVRCREREPFIVEFELQQYEDLTELNLSAIAEGSSLNGGQVRREPLFLVCTHGKRDKCCALYGRPLYKTLRQIEGDNVWQSSHVGGDRFAGNLVCFPHGLFYGHTTDQSGPRIALAYRERRLTLEGYRGRACYPHQTQAAEFFVRAEAKLEGVEDLRLLESRRVDEKSWIVKFKSALDAATYEASVTCHASEFENYVTCHATERKRVPQFRLENYRLVREASLKL